MAINPDAFSKKYFLCHSIIYQDEPTERIPQLYSPVLKARMSPPPPPLSIQERRDTKDGIRVSELQY